MTIDSNRLAHSHHQEIEPTVWSHAEETKSYNLSIFVLSLVDMNSSQVGLPNLLMNLEKTWKLCAGDVHDLLVQLNSLIADDSTTLADFASAYEMVRNNGALLLQNSHSVKAPSHDTKRCFEGEGNSPGKLPRCLGPTRLHCFA